MDGSLATCAPLGEDALEAPRRRLQVVLNPVAGRRNRALVLGVLQHLRARGLEVALRETSGPGDASALAQEAARESQKGAGADLLVVAGGDGTINEATNGLVAGGRPGPGSALPMAIIPLGTANVLAHEIGLTPRTDHVAETIAAGPIRRVSLGRAHSEDATPRCFILMAGVGFDAHVVEGVDLALKRRIGKGAYVWESLRQIVGFKFPTYRIDIDGREVTASSAIIANARSYAGPFVAAPDADLGRPGFHVLLFQRGGALAVARSAIALFRNKLHALPEVTLVEGRRIRIEGPSGDPVQGDGDTLTRLPVEIETLPDTLDLVVPAAR